MLYSLHIHIHLFNTCLFSPPVTQVLSPTYFFSSSSSSLCSCSRMEVSSRMKRDTTSPERRKVWMEPKTPRAKERKVPVVYYLSRNGHFEHPHFMEVSIPYGEGLYLRDVMKRLDTLRGKGMASMYSWSSKRSYRNGFVWHDLTEDDFIYPSHGNEYILKGSELLHLDSSPQDDAPIDIPKSVRDDSYIGKNRTARSRLDLHEYKVYKNKLTTEASMKNMDACTQTEDSRQNSRRRPYDVKDEDEEEEEEEEEETPPTELSRNEISPPSSTSSSETMEALIKADGSIVPIENVSNWTSRRKAKTSAALMQLIGCGSISVKERGLSLMSHFKGRMPRVMSCDGVKESGGVRRMQLEDKEHFSGSLIEAKEKGDGAWGEFSGLQRSSSCNAERSQKMELSEKEIEGVSAINIMRKLKATAAARNQADSTVTNSTNENKIADYETLQN